MTLRSTNPKDRIGISKVPLGLLPPAPQAHTAMAMLDGMLKYTRWNWRRESVSVSVYIDAARRHIEDWVDREECAPDSGVHHLGHACACLFILMDAQRCGKLVDDRPEVSSEASKLFEELSAKVKEMYARRGQEFPDTPPITDEPGTIDPAVEDGLDNWIDESLEDATRAQQCDSVAINNELNQQTSEEAWDYDPCICDGAERGDPQPPVEEQPESWDDDDDWDNF